MLSSGQDNIGAHYILGRIYYGNVYVTRDIAKAIHYHELMIDILMLLAKY